MKNLVLLCAFSFLYLSCDSIKDDQNLPELFSDLEILEFGAIPEAFESGRIAGDDENVEINLYLEVKSNKSEFPDVIYLNGLEMVQKSLSQPNQRTASRLNTLQYGSVETVTIPGRSFNDLTQSTDNSNPYIPNGLEIGCKKFDVVLRGEDCLGDICPDKSILGGRTWFCICMKECHWLWKS